MTVNRILILTKIQGNQDTPRSGTGHQKIHEHHASNRILCKQTQKMYYFNFIIIINVHLDSLK